MKFGKLILVGFFLISVSASSKNFAQPNDSPKLIRILNNYGRIPFEDGKTVVAEVKFVGLDIDDDDSRTIAPKIFKSDALKVLLDNKVSINADDNFYGAKISKAVKSLKEWIKSSGYFDVKITAFGEELPKNRMNLVFNIEKREPTYVSQLRFDGNVNLTEEELTENFKKCSYDDWKIFNLRKYQFYTQKCSRQFLYSKGFFKAKIERIKPQTIGGYRIVTITVNEGIRYRYGNIKIEGATLFTEEKILEQGGLKTGEIADGTALQNFVYEKLRDLYADKGYVLYNAEFDPEFVEPQIAGLDAFVDVSITIDEGKCFSVDKIEFTGIGKEKAEDLKKTFPLKENEIFNKTKFETGIKEINASEKFYAIDKESDVEYVTNEDLGVFSIKIKVKEIE